MKPVSRIYSVVCLLFVLVASVACSPAASAATIAPLKETAAPLADAPSTRRKAVNTLEGVKSATIQIVAEGSFSDPEKGTLLEKWSGSGFIIDESGLAVTNNHVVTGAGLLKVHVGGEREPRNARIVAVSECSDLAVIDIDGDGFPYLEWYPDAISVGLEVYTAGFPLGDPEFTLTRGIVSKERASGDTQWASIDHTIEHDATINPGNSGGPLVTKNGQVVGVNYAANKSTNQYFAVARAEALKVIEQLRYGKDVTSLGINGTALSNNESFSGIWVSSVKSGSPAGIAGLKPGDFILEMEGLPLAADGTMADYCDILRSHGMNDTFAVRVVRLDTKQILEGEFNGRKLEAATPPTPEPSPTEPSSPPSPNPTGYTTIVDDSGAIGLEVPSSWTDVNGGAWTADGNVMGARIAAAPNLSEFSQQYDSPGVFFIASRQLAQGSENTVLDHMKSNYGSCTYGGRKEYAGSRYTGQYDVWVGCGSKNSLILHLAAVPESRAFLIYGEVQVDNADTETAARILTSVVVGGNLP